jgi:hypothetical protein
MCLLSRCLETDLAIHTAMFYSVRNKPLYGEYVFIIYSVQMEVLTYESALVTFNNMYQSVCVIYCVIPSN